MSIKKIDRTVVDFDATKNFTDPFAGGTYFGNYNVVSLEWDAESDASGYNVYFSIFPLYRYKINVDAVITTNTYQFRLPVLPQTVTFYFWVSKIVNNNEVFINDDGETFNEINKRNFYEQTESPIEASYLFPETGNVNSAMKELILKRIPADTKFILQNDGTDCDVFMRRWGTDAPFGIPCACTNNSDANADFRGSDKCSLCFGTGIIGGFYPPIKMTIRFNLMPAKEFKGAVFGLKVSQTYDAWTLPEPILRAGDMIVRRYDGERYIVEQVATSIHRDVATRTDLKLNLLSLLDIRRIVSLETINAALSKTNDPHYNPQGRINF